MPEGRFLKFIPCEKILLASMKWLEMTVTQTLLTRCTPDGNVAIKMTPYWKIALGKKFTIWVCCNEFIKERNEYDMAN